MIKSDSMLFNYTLSASIENTYEKELRKFNMTKPIIHKGLGGFYSFGCNLNYNKTNKMKNFKLEDLKTGMRVETRSGIVYIVSYLKSPRCMLDASNRFLIFDCYNRHLKERGGQDKFDIMKIYSAPKFAWESFDFNITGELLWERKEEIPELTMSEAIEKIGFEFKLKK